MKHLIKSYVEPTTIYVMGCWFKGFDSTFGITDDYAYCYCIHIPTKGDGNKYTSYTIPNGNKSLDTCGRIYILTETELALALVGMDDDAKIELSQDGFKVENFIGDIYVDVINEEGLSLLKPNPNMKEDLLYEILDEHRDEGERDIRLIFPEGSLNGSETMECRKLVGIEDYE